MSKEFVYTEHPRIQAREIEGPATRANISSKAAKGGTGAKVKPGLNQRIGLAITNGVGTMWAAYAFFALTLVSLPAAIASGNAIVIISWIAQTFLQLVLLPIIIVGQNIQAKAADARAIATYNDADAILHDAKQIQKHLDTQDQALEHLITRMAKLEEKLIAQTKK
jgi:hypothetical protein